MPSSIPMSSPDLTDIEIAAVYEGVGTRWLNLGLPASSQVPFLVLYCVRISC